MLMLIPEQVTAAMLVGVSFRPATHAEVQSKSKYNTYMYLGLPPGPISNPGRGSIEATLSPDGSDYLYFVAKDARNHAFAKTLDEHQKNVDKYMKGP